MDIKHHSLAGRLESLERSNRRLEKSLRRERLFGFAMLIAAFSMVAVGANDTKPGSLEAERVVLRDAAGKTRAVLGIEVDGTAGLTIYDPAGKHRINLSTKPWGSAGLTLFDQNQEDRIGMGVRPEGSSELGFFDKGKDRLKFGVSPDGDAAQNIYDEHGITRLGQKVTPDGDSHLGFYDGASAAHLTLGSKADGVSALNFYEPDGMGRLSIHSKSYGKSGVVAVGRDRNPRLDLTIPPTENPTLRLFKADGDVQFQIPAIHPR